MPSCQKRTAIPMEGADVNNVSIEGQDRRECTEAGPEEDFMNHCGCD